MVVGTVEVTRTKSVIGICELCAVSVLDSRQIRTPFSVACVLVVVLMTWPLSITTLMLPSSSLVIKVTTHVCACICS